MLLLLIAFQLPTNTAVKIQDCEALASLILQVMAFLGRCSYKGNLDQMTRN